MLICVCLRILASSGIPRYDLGRQTPYFEVVLSQSHTLSVRVDTPCTTGHWLQPKILDMIDSLRWQMAGEPYTPYQKMAQPLQTKEEEPPI
jgi:hypothetical protein